MNERQRDILSILNKLGFASVTLLSDHFSVSEMTIRRDLDQLEAENAIRRVHGGAVPSNGEEEPDFDARALNRVSEKQVIAGLAASRVQNGSVIALDTGSSALELMRDLLDRRLTIITVNVHIINICLNKPNLQVIVPGGILRPFEGSLAGTATIDFIKNCHVDTFFMGVGGVSLEAGITEFSMEDIAVKRAFIANAQETVTLADSSKFGRVRFGRICGLEEINMIITNREAPPEYQDECGRLGVSLVYPAVQQSEVRKEHE